MKKIAFITGATSGIGWATAIKLAVLGYTIIACGRRKDRLEALAAALPKGATLCPLVFDIKNKTEVQEAFQSLDPSMQAIDILINNAGNAHGLEPIYAGDSEDWDAMMDINVKGLLYVTRTVLPKMLERGKGHIINVGSIAGKEVYANGSVYCASKFAVDALSTGLRKELYTKGIKVSQVCPGLVETEFASVRFKGNEEKAKTVYQGYQPLLAADVADAIAYILSAPCHVNVADMLLLPTDQASAYELNKK